MVGRLVSLFALCALAGCDERVRLLTVTTIRDAAASGPDGVAPEERPFAADSVASGQSHTCAVSDGALYCWGDNGGGALGVADSVDRNTPVRVGNDSTWSSVATGERSSCALGASGSVWCWGENSRGEAAAGDVIPHLVPNEVSLPGSATTIALRFNVGCALLGDRSLHCWGDNYEGQLGLDDPFPGGPTPNPMRLPAPDDWIEVDTGQGHVCGIRIPGALHCWGRNTDGQLGLGDGAFEQIRAPQRVGSDEDWIAVSVGQANTCGLRAGGTLWCWGHGADGALPFGEPEVNLPRQVGTDSGWSQVSVNTFGGCAIRSGELWCWGRNIEGQLGVGDIEDRFELARVGSDRTWIQVSAGRFHTCARRADRSLWCAGENIDGRLGVGDWERRDELTFVLTVEAPSR